jgi:hypothetical protein
MSTMMAFLIGVFCGGIAAAMSAKFLGFFNKQVTSVEKKV